MGIKKKKEIKEVAPVRPKRIGKVAPGLASGLTKGKEIQRG